MAKGVIWRKIYKTGSNLAPERLPSSLRFKKQTLCKSQAQVIAANESGT